jgi:hypothetical protein
MRVSKIYLIVALIAFILIVLGTVSFFTATHWACLTTQEAVQSPGITTLPESDVTTEWAGLQCKLANYSIRPVYYGAQFSVEKWVADRWEELPAPEGLRFELGINNLRPFSSVERFYPTGLFTANSGEGLYRIKQNIWVGEHQKANEQALYCQFTLS